jgi:SAM-dependent methyltransferase
MNKEKASYDGAYARFYDLFYSNKPYSEEARFVHERIIELSRFRTRRLLELACGTGGHAVYFARLGYEVTATDYSRDMLAEARKKAKRENVSIEFRELDMREIPEDEQPYDVVICLFDSIGYVQTDEALDAVFSGVNKNLCPGGLFVFEFWHAPPMVNSFDPVRIRRFPIEGGRVVRVAETSLEPERSLAAVTYTILELRNDGKYTELVETHRNRYFNIDDMEAWAPRCGFQVSAFYAGFETGVPVSEQTWHVLGVWKKCEARNH